MCPLTETDGLNGAQFSCPANPYSDSYTQNNQERTYTQMAHPQANSYSEK